MDNQDVQSKKRGRPKKINSTNKDNSDNLNNITKVNITVDSDNYNMLKIIANVQDVTIKDILNNLIYQYVKDNLNIVKSIQRLKSKVKSVNIDKSDKPNNEDKQDNPDNIDSDTNSTNSDMPF